MNHEKRFSLTEAFRFGFYTLIENFAFFLALMFVYFAVMVVACTLIITIAALPYAGKIMQMVKVLDGAGVPRADVVLNIAKQLGAEFSVILSLAATAIYFINRCLALGFSKVSLDFYDKKGSSLGTLFSCYRLILKDAAAAFLYWLMCSLGFLLIIPGFYFGITYGFFHLFIVDQEVGVFESFKKSAELTRGSKWQLFALWALFILLNYAAFIIFGITLIFVWPLTSLVYAYAYRKLQGR